MKFSRGKTGALAFFILIAVLIVTMHACMPSFRMSKKEVDEYFTKNHVRGSQHCYETGFREIHYVEAGDESKPLVLFIHGSPGSLSAFIHFLADSTLTKRALLISTDRPGFGYSNYGNAEPSLHKQGEALIPIIEKNKNSRPVILVGHSLGGPLIARIAMDHPELIDGLVIVAGSIAPELEPNEIWFRAPLATPFLSWILPGAFRASNQEIYHLKPELEEMLPLWKNIKCPVIVIQGTKDELVAPENAAFAERMLTSSQPEVVRVEGMNHFVPWSNPELIHDAILRMLEKSAQNADSHAGISADH
jgi:pimeloyl-ACP methyl ester carboxylesterase